MSSRRPRSSFAVPLVVTLALAPACIVRTPSSTPPPGARQTTEDHRGDGAVVANPPRPGGTADSAPPPGRQPSAGSPMTPDRVDQTSPTPPARGPSAEVGGSVDVTQAGPAPDPNLRSWTVYQSPDKSCYAMHQTSCPPAPATCNPPPPAKVKSCPAGITPKASVQVRELSPDDCYVMYAAPACPAGASCNPPRPAKIDCPAY